MRDSGWSSKLKVDSSEMMLAKSSPSHIVSPLTTSFMRLEAVVSRTSWPQQGSAVGRYGVALSLQWRCCFSSQLGGGV